MAFTGNFKLLQMPYSGREDAHKMSALQNATPQKPQNIGIKLLSLPQQSPVKNRTPFSLVQIPVKSTPKEAISLLKLTRNVEQKPQRHKHELSDGLKKAIESTYAQPMRKLPLLSKPAGNPEPSIIRLPLAMNSDSRRMFPRLIELPVKKQEDRNYFAASSRERNFMPPFKRSNDYPQLHLEQGNEDEAQEIARNKEAIAEFTSKQQIKR